METKANPRGLTTEAPAGRFDYQATPTQLAVNEVKEETGIDLKPEEITILNDGQPLATSPGVLTEKVYLCFAQVRLDNLDRTHNHFRHHREDVHRLFIPVEEFRTMTLESAKLFALREWFFGHIYDKSTA